MSIETHETFGSEEGHTFVSRAVKRNVKAGMYAICIAGDGNITFNQKTKPQMVIANVYDDNGVWQSTDMYHAACYDAAGEPYGRPFSGAPLITQEQRDDVAQSVAER